MKLKLLLFGFFSVFAFAFLSVAPDAVLGQAFDYTPLETIPGSTTADTKTFPGYVQGIYKFGIWSVGLAALFMLSVGGFIYLSSGGNTATISKAKTYIWDALIGLVLALLAWLILFVINPDLVSVNLDTFSEVGGTVTPATPQVKAVVDGTNALPVYAASCTKPTSTQNSKTVACMNRQMTNASNISTYGSISSSGAQSVLNSAGNLDASGFDLSSSGNCWDSTCTNCTSLHQIPKYAVQYLKDLKTKSGCTQTLVITGGTEYGHTTHCPNAPSIDIRNTDAGGVCLGNYLKTVKASVGNDQKKYEDKLQKDLHIDVICADSAWSSVDADCGSYQEPNGHFHFSFCGYVHGAAGSVTGTVECK